MSTLEKLDIKDLEKDMGVGRGTIKNILIHLMNSENYWISILTDTKFEALHSKDCSDIPSIRKTWCDIEARTLGFIENLEESQLQHVRNVTWKKGTISFTVGKALIHMATHETHHRGLLIGLIRQLGLDPPDVNML